MKTAHALVIALIALIVSGCTVPAQNRVEGSKVGLDREVTTSGPNESYEREEYIRVWPGTQPSQQ